MTVKTKLATVGLATVVVLVTGSVAAATVPGAGGVITGCRDLAAGGLRVIDAEGGTTCESTEEQLAWNQTGPQGPKGDPGPAGPVGTAGGLSEVYASSGSASIDGANYKVIATVNLPAGKYLVNGAATSLNQQTKSAVVSCNLRDSQGAFLGSANATLPAPATINASSYATTPILATANLTAPGHVRVECIVGNAVAGIWQTAKLTALTIGDIKAG